MKRNILLLIAISLCITCTFAERNAKSIDSSSKDAKRLWFGNDLQQPPRYPSYGGIGDIPSPVIISSQPIKINQNNKNNNGYGKRNRRQSGYSVPQTATVIDPASGQSFIYTQQEPQPQESVQQQQFAAAPQSQQQQLFVLGQDGNTYMQYNPQQQQQQQQQQQFASRSGEIGQHQQAETHQKPQIQVQPVAFVQQQHQQQHKEPVEHKQQQQQQPQMILQPHAFLQQAQMIHMGQQPQPQPQKQPGFEDRSTNVQPNGQPVPHTQFVIQPHTYVQGGSGGQMFTVPVPIPVEQIQQQQRQRVQQQQHQQQQHNQQQHHQQQQRPQQHHSSSEEKPTRERDDKEREHKKNRPPYYVHRFMEAINPNRKSIMERVETNAALPILASSGVLFGLGALAAGWYLSKSNREVGILRRVGKPSQPTAASLHPGILKLGQLPSIRNRRELPSLKSKPKRQIPHYGPPQIPQEQEVDQATFFQSIIQHALEKQQEKFDVEPAVSQYPINTNIRSDHVDVKPHSYRNDRVDDAIEKVSKAHKKHGKGGKKSWRQIKTFASVAVPAIVLGGAVIGITALIFFWYLSGNNREIAFLEPAAYSRKKRSLADTLSDSWFHKTITAIHKNPFDEKVDKVDPLSAIEEETNKSADEGRLSTAVFGGILAAGTVIAMAALILAWFSSGGTSGGFPWLEQAEHVGWGHPHQYGGHHGGHHGGHGGHGHRSTRSLNDISYGQVDNPGFLASILSNLEVVQTSIINKLQEAEYKKWHTTPCAKRIFCDVMMTQQDDTIRLTEKRMAVFLSMLPESLSNSLSRTMSDVMSSIYKKNCSAYTCNGGQDFWNIGASQEQQSSL